MQNKKLTEDGHVLLVTEEGHDHDDDDYCRMVSGKT